MKVHKKFHINNLNIINHWNWICCLLFWWKVLYVTYHKPNHEGHEHGDQRHADCMCGKCTTTMLKGCCKSNLWTGKVISSSGTLECNCNDLPTVLDGSKSKNNISKPLGYFSRAFGAPQGLGGFWCFEWFNIKPYPSWWTTC